MKLKSWNLPLLPLAFLHSLLKYLFPTEKRELGLRGKMSDGESMRMCNVDEAIHLCILQGAQIYISIFPKYLIQRKSSAITLFIIF